MPLMDDLYKSENMHGMVGDIAFDSAIRRSIQHLALLGNIVAACT